MTDIADLVGLAAPDPDVPQCQSSAGHDGPMCQRKNHHDGPHSALETWPNPHRKDTPMSDCIEWRYLDGGAS